MGEANRERLWSELMAFEGDAMEFVVERVTIEEGRTFSADAMEALHDELIVFITTRLVRRWDQTGEPPTALVVHAVVKVG